MMIKSCQTELEHTKTHQVLKEYFGESMLGEIPRHEPLGAEQQTSFQNDYW